MGVFWHNAAETWVDITNAAANKVGLVFMSDTTYDIAVEHKQRMEGIWL